MPKRIQRKRTKGWRAPEGTVNVTRPGKWGNPIKVDGFYYKVGNGGDGLMWVKTSREYADSSYERVETPEQAVALHRRLVTNYPPKDLDELRGKDLMCFCPLNQPCHADTLLEIANA